MFLTRVFNGGIEDEHKGVKPIIEGYLLKKSKSSSVLKTKYFKLFPDAQLIYYRQRGGQARGVMKLTEDFYVSDHELHPNGFQISDFDQKYYLAAVDHDSKMFWMHTIAGVLRRLAKAGAEALPPQYSEVMMTKVQQDEGQDHLENSRVSIYQDQAPPSPPPPQPKTPIDSEETALRLQLSEMDCQVNLLQRTIAELTSERDVEASRAEGLRVENTRLQSELTAAKSQLKEAEARVSSLEAQMQAVHQTEGEERRQEVQRVRSAVEAEWAAKADEAKRKAEAEASSKLSALHRQYDDLRKTMDATTAALTAEMRGLESEKDALLGQVADLTNRLEHAAPAPTSARSVGSAAISTPNSTRSSASAASSGTAPPPKAPRTPTTPVPTQHHTFAPEGKPEAKVGSPPPPPPRSSPSAPSSVTSSPALPSSVSSPPVVTPSSTLSTPTTGDSDGSSIKQLTAQWASKAAIAESSNKANPFSKSFDPSTTRTLKGTEGYGKPPPGSKSEERAKHAKEWVDTEIDKLIAVINTAGTKDSQGRSVIKFGPLFMAYQDISDTLVGIMMRAKKRRKIQYVGDMLWKNCDDEVLITVLA